MRTIEITPTPLNGIVNIPPSKSLCHRAIIAASIASGTSILENILLSDDILATIDAVQALGAQVDIKNDIATIKGGIPNITTSPYIDCRESGSTLRFIIPIGLISEHEICYKGTGNLSKRPMKPYIKMFEEQGIYYSSETLPISISGRLKPGTYELPGDISSQFITGLMFALPVLKADSVIHLTNPLESKGYIDLTIETLNKFGIKIINHNYKRFAVSGNQHYTPTEYAVEGDYSQAAFWIAAGLLGCKVESKNLDLCSKQGDKAFVDIMKNCGADIQLTSSAVASKLTRVKGFDADVSQYPDITPILAVMAALAEGTSHITGASRLRMKESDRLKAISTELNKLGAEVYEDKDNLTIIGKEKLRGGEVDSWGDHRIAMMLCIASIKCTSAVTIRNSNVVHKSYPAFYDDFVKLGGIINER